MSFPETIFSKISNDTVLPLSLVDDVAAFTVKCKPYSIIDERRVHDRAARTGAIVSAVRSPSPAQRRAKRARESTPSPRVDRHAATTAAPCAPAASHVHHSPMRSARASSSTSQLPSPHKTDAHVTDGEDEEDGEKDKAVSWSCAMRPGWAARQLSEATPYQVPCEDDLTRHTRYVADEEDMTWCAQQRLSLPLLQRGMTRLEWAYVQLVQRFHEDAAGGCGGGRRSRQAAVRDGHTRHANAKADTLCAVCGEAVQLVPGVRPATPAPTLDPTCPVIDTLDRGVRCAQCNTAAHLFCWGLPAAFVPTPFAPWVCDGCFSSLREYSRQASVRCVLCGREAAGQVVFRFRPPQSTLQQQQQQQQQHAEAHSAAGLRDGVGEALDESGDVIFLGAVSQKENGRQPQSAYAAAGNKAAAAAKALLVCHAVCALACAECELEQPVPLLRRSGMVNMHARPVVTFAATSHLAAAACVLHGSRRRAGQGPHGVCAYCHTDEPSASTKVECVRCGFASCALQVHPSCAAAARAVWCQRSLPCVQQQEKHEEEIHSADASHMPQYWTDCVAYCPLHRLRACWHALAEYSAQAEQHVYDTTRLRDLVLPEDMEVSKSDTLHKDDDAPVKHEDALLAHKRRARQGHQSLSRTAHDTHLDLICQRIRDYWRSRREARRAENVQWLYEVHVSHRRSVREAAVRPELLKRSETRLRASQLLSLVPEWQHWLMCTVEGALPIADDEYDESDYALRPRHKAASALLYNPHHHHHKDKDLPCEARHDDTTRRARRDAWLEAERDALKRVEGQVHAMRAVAELVRQRCATRAAIVELRLREMDLQCGFDATPPH